MAKQLSLENISKSYGEKVLFQHLSMGITAGDRIGLIGVNGTGKSSLLKVIAGIEEPDSGNIVSSRGFTVAMLSQQPVLNEEATILEQIFSLDNPLLKIQRDYELALAQLNEQPNCQLAQERLFACQQQMDAKNIWDINVSLKSMLTKLGLHDLTVKIASLSGGQRKRVAMAATFAQNPDLLILDEPTNHLDYETIEWLENYLTRYSGAVMFVTHDRYFLDRVTNRIMEIDNGSVYFYTGNYATFLEAKALRIEQELSAHAKHQNLFRQELAWIRRGAKARTTKQKARIDRFEALKEVSGPTSQEGIDIALAGSRLGKKVLDLNAVSKAFGEKVIVKDFSFIVAPQSRVGIVGKNGYGKTTLLELLAGRLQPDSGSIDQGATIKLAYYTQETTEMNLNERMLSYIKDAAEVVHTTDGKTISASQMLERFLFPTYSHGLPIGKLSGGERRRLYLLKLLMTEPNLLFLDEPTNDLDTQTLTILEDYLETFPGTVITVSHDRYFLDKVVDQLLILGGDGSVDVVLGAYSDYLAKTATLPTVAAPTEKKTTSRQPKTKKKLSYNEQKEWDVIEDEIAQLEEQLEQLAAAMNETGSDFVKAQEIMVQQEETEKLLEEKMLRWEQLAELIASFEA